MESAPSIRLRVCSWVFTLAAVFLGSAPLIDFIPNHVFDASWPTHARFHVALAASHVVTLAIITLLVIWFPFRNGRRWSWVALALLTFFGLGTIPLISVWMGSGPPFGRLLIIGGLFALMLGALTWSWQPIFRK